MKGTKKSCKANTTSYMKNSERKNVNIKIYQINNCETAGLIETVEEIESAAARPCGCTHKIRKYMEPEILEENAKAPGNFQIIQEEDNNQDIYEQYKSLMKSYKAKYIHSEDSYESNSKTIKSPYVLEQMREKMPAETIEKAGGLKYRTIDLRDGNHPTALRTPNGFYRVSPYSDSENKPQKNLTTISQRCDAWAKAKERKLNEMKEAELVKEMEGCTFKPSRVTEKSNLAKVYETAVESKNEALYKYALMNEQSKLRQTDNTEKVIIDPPKIAS